MQRKLQTEEPEMNETVMCVVNDKLWGGISVGEPSTLREANGIFLKI